MGKNKKENQPCSKKGCAAFGVFEEEECPGSDSEDNSSKTPVDWLSRRHHCVNCGELWPNEKGSLCDYCCDFWCPEYQSFFTFVKETGQWVCPTCVKEVKGRIEVKKIKRKISEMSDVDFEEIGRKVKREKTKRKMAKLPLWSKRIISFYNIPNDSVGAKTIRKYCEENRWIDYGPGEREMEGSNLNEMKWDDVPLFNSVSYMWDDMQEFWKVDDDVLDDFNGESIKDLPEKYKARRKDWRKHLEFLDVDDFKSIYYSEEEIDIESHPPIPPPWSEVWYVNHREFEEILFEMFMEIVLREVNTM